jgi:ABC-type multidrug transport system permease subunit
MSRQLRAGYGRQFLLLTQIRLSGLRRIWLASIVITSLMPLLLLYFMRLAGVYHPDRVVYFVTLVFGPVLSLADRLSWAKANQEFDYYETLPVNRLLLMLAVLSASLITAIPAVAVVLWGSAAMYDLPIRFGPSALVISLLATASMAGLGAVIGLYAKNTQMASLLVNAVLGFSMLASPTFVPREVLHPALQNVSRFVPVSYAASGLRAALTAGTFPVVDALVLLLFGVGLAAIALQNMGFRE